MYLDFLKLAQNGNPMLSIIGEFEWQCRDIGPGMPLPYTSDGDSYMPVILTLHSVFIYDDCDNDFGFCSARFVEIN